jgi:hypothetical protein
MNTYIEGITKHGYKFVITCMNEGKDIVYASLTLGRTRDDPAQVIELKPNKDEIDRIAKELSTKGYIPHHSSITAFA